MHVFVPVGKKRDDIIDIFRGLSILLMAAANYMEHISIAPAALKHAPDIGSTLIDFIAPAFMFAVGLTYPGSVRKRLETEGMKRAGEHIIRRSAALIGIGALLSIGESVFGFSRGGIPWGTLQAIGVSVLLTFPTLFIPGWYRLITAAVLLAGYQWGVSAFWLETVTLSSHGGLPGSLGWAAMLMTATVFGDLHSSGKRTSFFVLSAVILAGGVGLSILIPVSKLRVSASYVLVSLAACAFVFGFFSVLRRWTEPFLGFLRPWGANPIVLYVAHLVLLSVFLVPEVPHWHTEAPAWQAGVQGTVYLALLHLLARILRRRQIIIRL